MPHFTAVVFKGRGTAQKALDTLADEATYAEKAWVDEVAVLSRGKHGYIRINSTWAQDDATVTGGVGFGALTGGLLGAMMGPAGAIAGAIGAGALAGGSIGGMMGIGVDFAAADQRLEDFASRLENDTSALVLVANYVIATEFRSAFGPAEGEIIETELNEHHVNALREALKAERSR